jgi:cell division protein FtsL
MTLSTVFVFLGSMVAGIFGVWLSNLSKDREPTKHRLAIIFLLTGVFLTAIGGVFTDIENNKFQNKLDNKNIEITQLNKKILNNIIGGNSFCYVRTANITNDNAFLILAHNGSEPIYDVSIRIVDIQKAEKININEAITLDKLYYIQNLINIGNLSPNSRILLGNVSLYGKQRSFNIFINARNGSLSQYLRFYRKDNDWLVASKVLREGDNEQVLYDKISPGFPKENLNW